MHETQRRFLFLLLILVVFVHQGAHISQVFVNYASWDVMATDSFIKYHEVMKYKAGMFLLLPRVIEILLACMVLGCPPAGVRRWMILVGMALALCALLSTALIQ